MEAMVRWLFLVIMVALLRMFAGWLGQPPRRPAHHLRGVLPLAGAVQAEIHAHLPFADDADLSGTMCE
jgi:hypothetical protein